MFGLDKKKEARKKVSTSAKKQVSKKKVSKSKAKTSKTTKKETSAKKTVVRPKTGQLKVGNKIFDSPKEVAAYYRAEGERVKKAMNQFKIDKAEGYLSIAKKNLMKFLSQKKRLGLIAQDLEEHKSVLNKKIADLNAQKTKSRTNKNIVEKFVRKMKSLEAETKKILDTKEQLIQREAELISEMKEMAKIAQRDLDLTDVATANGLARFESSKEAVLARTKELLPEEMSKLFADNSLLDSLDDRAYKRMRQLNTQLAQIYGAKKETLEKRHVLEISEEETEDRLAQAEAKVNKLEGKYQTLLKK